MSVNKLCCMCKVNPVHVKLWRMCSACYQRFRLTDAYDEWRNRLPEQRLQERKQQLIQKYGAELFVDLANTETNPFTSLQDIANRYGISRERVRQIYKKYFGGVAWGKAVASRRVYEPDIGCPYDPLQKKLAFEVGLRPNFVKDKVQIALTMIQRCKNFGLSVQSCVHSRYVINGHLTVLHTSSKATPTSISSNGSMTYYRIFLANKPSEKEVEFTIGAILPSETFYIIPRDVWSEKTILYVPGNHVSSKISIQEQLDKYKERWDLFIR